MADFDFIPVDISAAELEARVKLPIDTVAKSGSENLVTSGAAFDVSSDKIPILPRTIKTEADVDDLFSNSSYDVGKVIYDISVSGLSSWDDAKLLADKYYFGTVSEDDLLLISRKSGKAFKYSKTSKILEQVFIDTDDIMVGAITSDKLKELYVIYEGKYTVSTFDELENDFFGVGSDRSRTLYAFTFSENSELSVATNGAINVVAIGCVQTHKWVFLNIDTGDTWLYSNKSFAKVNLTSKVQVVSKKETLNGLFDTDVDFLSTEYVGGAIPNGRYLAYKAKWSNAFRNGYLFINLETSDLYFYSRDTETFQKYDTPIRHIGTFNNLNDFCDYCEHHDGSFFFNASGELTPDFGGNVFLATKVSGSTNVYVQCTNLQTVPIIVDLTTKDFRYGILYASKDYVDSLPNIINAGAFNTLDEFCDYCQSNSEVFFFTAGAGLAGEFSGNVFLATRHGNASERVICLDLNTPPTVVNLETRDTTKEPAYATINYVNNLIGKIDTALDNVIALQESYIGGVTQ